MAREKKVFDDGAVIFREGESGEAAFELISGSVDLLVKRDGKYAREQTISAGEVFGVENDTKGGIRLFTARANGRTVIRATDPKNLPALIDQTAAQEASTGGFLDRLKVFLKGATTKPARKSQPATPYSNVGLLRNMVGGMGADPERISIRVAILSGHDGQKHTRHLISAIGNTAHFQTRSLRKTLSTSPDDDIPKQLNQMSAKARRYLRSQNADLLIWGHVPEPGTAIHLHFITLADWDQQVPGAFNLETTLALPIDFGAPVADLLRLVCLAATIPSSVAKRAIRSSALLEGIENAEQAFEAIPADMSDREKASLYLCYGNAISAAARPGYDSALLLKAAGQYRSALGSLSPDSTPADWAQAKKHHASILHIEGERNANDEMIDQAKRELEEVLDTLDGERHPYAWGITQNRLGMIYFKQGFRDGDTNLIRQSLRHFQSALKVYTRTESPNRWTEIMSHFAQAAQVLGGLLQNPEALATAASACQSVLEMRDRERAPKAWATSQHNLASALFLLGKQTRNAERLKASVTAYESALEVYQIIDAKRRALTTARNLARARDLVDQYQPKNVPQLEWEEALAEGVGKTSKFDEAPPPKKDPLPWPGENLPQQASHVG